MGTLDAVLGDVKQQAQMPPPTPSAGDAAGPAPPADAQETTGFQNVLKGVQAQANPGSTTASTPQSSFSEDDIMRSMQQKRQAMGVAPDKGPWGDAMDLSQHTSATRILAAFGHGTVDAATEALSQRPLATQEDLDNAAPVKGENAWVASMNQYVVRPAIYDAGIVGGFAKMVAGLTGAPFEGVAQALEQTGKETGSEIPAALASTIRDPAMMMVMHQMAVPTPETIHDLLTKPPLPDHVYNAIDKGIIDPSDPKMKEEAAQYVNAQAVAFHAEQAVLPKTEPTLFGKEHTQPPDLTIHEAVRQQNPALFGEYDALKTRADAYSSTFEDMLAKHREDVESSAPHNDEIADLKSKIEGADTSKRQAKKYQDKIDDLTEKNQDYIEDRMSSPNDFPPDIRNLRGELAKITQRIGDLAPDVKAATASAAETLPKVETLPAETAPVEQAFEPTEGHLVEFKAAEPSETAAPEAATVPQDTIASTVSKSLQDTGRSKEEADAGGQIASSFYKTLSDTYGGKHGTAEDWFAREGATVKAGGEGKSKRGAYRAATDTAKAVIRLMKSADASTFIHETGHHFLSILDRYAGKSDTPRALKDDYATVRKWLGVKDDDDLFAKNEKGRFTYEKQQEKFAKGFENYVREGIAPSKELAGVFSKFGTWLKNIYKSALKLDTPITDDIRGVFDRLLASKPEKTVIAPEAEVSSRATEGIPKTEEAEATPATGDKTASETPTTKPETNSETATTPEEVPTEAAAPERSLGGKTKSLDKLRDKAGNIRTELLTNKEETRAALREMAEKTGLMDHDTTSDAEIAETARAMGVKAKELNIQKLRELSVEDNISLAARIRAGRQMLVEVADEVSRLSDKVENGTDADLQNFMEAKDRFMMVAETVSGITYEWGLAGRAFKDISGEAVKSAEQMSELFQQITGTTKNGMKDLAKLVSSKNRTGVKGGAARVMQAAAKPGFWDHFAEYRRCSILSGWVTHSMWLAGTGVNLAYKALVLDTLGGLHNEIGVMAGRTDTGSRVFGGMEGLARTLTKALPNILSATGTAIRTGKTVLRPFEGEYDTFLATGGIRKTLNVNTDVLKKAVDDAFKVDDHEDLKALQEKVDAAKEQGNDIKTSALQEMLDKKSNDRRAQMAQTLAAQMQNRLKTWSELGGEMHDFASSVLSGIETVGKNMVSPDFYKDKPLLSAKRDGGALPDIYAKGVPVLPLGSVMRGASNRIYSAMHTFTREISANIETVQEARRMAVEEGLTGDAAEQRRNDLLTNPSKELMQRVNKIANKQTLMSNESSFAKAMTRFVADVNRRTGTKIGSVIAPVIGVPAEATAQTVIDSSIFGVISKNKRAALTGELGGVEQERAQVKMLAGTAMLGLGFWLAEKGLTTPSPSVEYKQEQERRDAGMQSGSVRLGDWMVSLSHLPVTGTILTAGADLHHIMGVVSGTDTSDKIKPAISSMVDNFFLHENALVGLSDLVDAMRLKTDPMTYLKNQGDSLMPQFISQTNNVIDPLQRDSKSFLASLASRVPYLSEVLPAKINALNGEPLERKPFKTNTAIPDPIAQNLMGLHIYPANPKPNINGVDLDPKQAAEYSSAKGHILYNGLTMLMKADGAEDYEDADTDGKRKMVQRIQKHAADCSKSIMFNKYPQLLKDANDRHEAECAEETGGK